MTLTSDEVAQIKEGHFTVALVWHEMSEYTRAVDRGAQAEFADLGIEVVAQTDAGFDAARQQSDVETVLAGRPSIILSLPVDPTSAAAVYRPALEAGVKLAFVDNSPAGFEHGRDYAAVVSDDLFQMGKKAADAMAAALGSKGKVGYIYHDADFYVTNQRDGAFKATIEADYPDMEIVAEQGMADPARSEEIAQALLTQNPDLDGIYVTWAEPALSVLAALKAASNSHTKIVTLDLNEPAALDMVQGGNFAAIVADEAYEIGRTAARAAAAALIDKEAAPFLVVNSLAVTKDSVAEGWQRSLHTDAPASVLEAAK
jgi:ribose transport system substrate-binding protein